MAGYGRRGSWLAGGHPIGPGVGAGIQRMDGPGSDMSPGDGFLTIMAGGHTGATAGAGSLESHSVFRLAGRGRRLW